MTLASTLRAALFVVLILFAGTVALAWRLNPKTPEWFNLSFTGVGVVEAIGYGADGSCAARIALYDWVSLGQNVTIKDIPQRDDRYLLYGEGEACRALNVAMAAAQNHIEFRAGRSQRRWYFADKPTAAIGCCGLETAWVPTPYKQQPQQVAFFTLSRLRAIIWG